jgi:hypothetical protein
MNQHAYVGSELELFEKAYHWKWYVKRRLHRYLGDEVLEVGAGIAGTTQVLNDGMARRWVCLEPDAELADRIRRRVDDGSLPANCAVVAGTIRDLGRSRFDTVLYMDVLEHIEEDRLEVVRAAQLIRPGGHLIVLAPAHQWLFTAFDASIGHHRRYDSGSLKRMTPSDMDLARCEYLDSVGLLASLGNRLLLNQDMPTERQIAVWDRLMVPASRVVDAVTCFSLGKSLLACWRKRDRATNQP